MRILAVIVFVTLLVTVRVRLRRSSVSVPFGFLDDVTHYQRRPILRLPCYRKDAVLLLRLAPVPAPDEGGGDQDEDEKERDGEAYDELELVGLHTRRAWRRYQIISRCASIIASRGTETSTSLDQQETRFASADDVLPQSPIK